MAKEQPAQESIPRSFSASPKAITSSGVMPSRPQRTARAAPLSALGEVISRLLAVELAQATGPVAAMAASSSSRSSGSTWKTLNFSAMSPARVLSMSSV